MLLYFGNMLERHGYNPTSVETIGAWLSNYYPVTRASSFKNVLLRLIHMWWVLLSNRRDCKLILIDTYSTKAFTFAWTLGWIAKRLNLKYVPILRGGDLPKRFRCYPKISEQFITNAEVVIAPSGYLKYEVEKLKWNTPAVFPNTIILSNYPFKKRERVRPKLLWVRSFHRDYNPLMALDVLKHLINQGYSDVNLCMVGPDKDGSMQIFREQAELLALNNNISVLGRLSKTDWIEKSKEYDIFINTTNIDNTPVSVMEAMALGMPIVTTNAGGIPFLFDNREEGVMVAKEDSLAMANAIIDLIEDSKLAEKYSRNGRLKALEWDWELVERKWKDLIDEYLK